MCGRVPAFSCADLPVFMFSLVGNVRKTQRTTLDLVSMHSLRWETQAKLHTYKQKEFLCVFWLGT